MCIRDSFHHDANGLNARGQSSYLNTYNLSEWGDNLHSASNDQIATSPQVLLGESAVLTVWAHGGGSGTHAPELDPNAAEGYTGGSSGIAVCSAVDGSILATVHTQGKSTLKEDVLDLSAFAGQKVIIEVVDAFEGGWGWLAVDEIQITNAIELAVNWDFENGNDHHFILQSAYTAAVGVDDPNIAGDEAITGAGGFSGLPDVGVAWTVGPPNQFDGLIPVVEEGCHVVDGVLQYGPCNDPFGDRVGNGFLNTYNLNQWGDNLHIADNDQIASSPAVILKENAVLTAWSLGGGSGTHAPEYDPNPALWYTDGSSGIAVISAEGDDQYAILATLHLNGKGTLTEDTLDLSAFAGRKVFIDVVDAFQGSWGWLAIDEIRIENAILVRPEAIADYGFDVDASDATGSFNGTLEGDAAIVEDTERGNVLGLTADGYVSIPPELANELENFSFTAWVKYGGTVQWAGLLGMGQASSFSVPYWDFHMRADGILSFYGSLVDIWPGDGTAMEVTDFTIPAEWIHIGFTFTLGTGGTVYVNGVEQTLKPWNSSNDHDVSPSMIEAEDVTIGRDTFNQGTLTNTLIDDFKFYNGALYADEIAEIYEAEK